MDLSIIDKQLNVGQVKSIRTGQHLDYIEMKFSNELSAQIAPLGDGTIQFDVRDTEFRLPNMSCKMEKSVVRDLIISLRELYTQIENNTTQTTTNTVWKTKK